MLNSRSIRSGHYRLIHLPYVAQVTNTQPTAVTIVGVVPVDPLANFTPTGRNLITNEPGNDVAGKVAPFAAGRRPAGRRRRGRDGAARAGLFVARAGHERRLDVLRRDLHRPGPGPAPARPRDHAGARRQWARRPRTDQPRAGGLQDTAVLRPPLVGHGWSAFNGCCTVAVHHRDAIQPINGLTQAGSSSPPFIQLGPDNTCCNGPPKVPSSWFGYGTPVLAAASGVVAPVVDGLPDQPPVGAIAINFPPGTRPATASSRISAAAASWATRTLSPARSRPRCARVRACAQAT